MKNEKKTSDILGGSSRRSFLKVGAGSAAGTWFFLKGFGIGDLRAALDQGAPDPLQDGGAVKMIRSACMMCNAGCGIQVKVKNGVALKIEGNPFCVHTNDYATAGSEAAASDIPDNTVNSGRICVRGNSGLMTLYDPYRIKTPLKRTGPRGSGQFEAIGWEQALTEIAAALTSIRAGLAPMDAGDTDFADEAPAPGNPASFGLKANQYVWVRGRDQIAQITKRFNDAFGTKNHVEHSSTCNTAWALSMKANFPGPMNKNKYQYHRVELDNVSYLIILGSNPLEANVGTTYWQRKLMTRRADGSLAKIVAVDPFMTHTAAKADQWVPIKPGGDFAFVMAMLRRMIGIGAGIDAAFLKIPNLAGAQAAGYRNYTNSSYLVRSDTHRFLSGHDAGTGPDLALQANITTGSNQISAPLGSTAAFPASGFIRIDNEIIYYASKSSDASYDYFNVYMDGSTAAGRAVCNTSAAAHAAGASISPAFTVIDDGGSPQPHFAVASTDNYNFTGTVNGIPAASAYALVHDEIMSRTVEEWAALCEIAPETIQALVNEWNAAARPCLEAYRGAWAHGNGTYVAMAVNLFNALTGRVDRLGGYCMGKRFGVKEPARNPAFPSQSGVRIDRAGSKYSGAPAEPTRQWYYTAGVVTQEVLPSAAMGYPYKVKAMCFYCFNPGYTIPVAGPQQNALLAGGSGAYNIPLTWSVSIFMDETAALCDYVLPDSTYLERFSAPFTSYPTVKTKSGTIRRPVVGTYKDITVSGRPARVYIPLDANLNGTNFADAADFLANWSGPMPYDEQLIQLAKLIGLPGFGQDGMGAGAHMDTAYQFWAQAFLDGDLDKGGTGLGNEGASGFPGDSTEESMILGGRWENPAQVEHATYAGWQKNLYGDLISLYDEKIGTSKNYMTHEYYHGYPKWRDPRIGQAGDLHDDPGFKFRLLTCKRVFHTQSRSSSNQWLRELQSAGFAYLNAADAERLKVATGDLVKLTSPSGKTTAARARVVGHLKPGCVMVDHHFGRDWFGSRPYTVSGVPSAHDPSIGDAGAFTNQVYRPDSAWNDICLTDGISGQVSFYDAKVNVTKV